MALVHEKKTDFVNENSPLKEPIVEEEEYELEEDYEEDGFVDSGCGCLWLPFFRKRQCNKGASTYLLQQQQGECGRENWWVKRVKEAKEISEVIAGPKWKTFIRKFGSYCKNNKKRKSQFQYDPQSYALNFDGSMNQETDDGAHVDFSARFAGPFVMNSGELGREQASFPLNRGG